MTPDRERQILAHLYGTTDGTVTALRGRWATEADAPRLIGDWADCWLAPGLEYHPSATEMIITLEEADALTRLGTIHFIPFDLAVAQGLYERAWAVKGRTIGWELSPAGKAAWYMRRDMRNYVSSNFPDYKLADDGINFGPGQAIITPSLWRGHVINRARIWEAQGWVEAVDSWKAGIVVTRPKDTDADRLDTLLPPDIINNAMVFAFLVQPRV